MELILKILRGIFKNKALKVPINIRPATLRLKKAIFDIMDGEIADKYILDLFAGSGALGIESLSCGAKKACFVDLKKAAIKAIIANLTSIKACSSSEVLLKDSFKAIKDFYHDNRQFDVVFLDPPYYRDMHRKALQTINDYDILAPSGYVITLCYRPDSYPEDYCNFELIVNKRYGQSSLLIYRKK